MRRHELAIAVCSVLLAAPLVGRVEPGADAALRSAPADREAAGSVLPVSARRVAGYFVAWGIYRRNFLVKNVATSGAAERLTHIDYAFANIGTDLKCTIGDSWADIEKPFGAHESVDDVADPASGTLLRGNFNQLRKLKQLYPHLQVLISIGGWTWSERFSDAALPQNRAAFVSSCIDLYLRGNFAPGITDPTVFDGIDLDWEYPGACGNTCNFRPEDTQNFTALLAEFRGQMNALSDSTRKPLLLTIAAGAAEDKYTKLELSKIHPYLDFINLLSYDFHGAWDANTNFHAPLHGSAADPVRSQRLWGDAAVQAYLSAGVPPQKLSLGVPWYGRGWKDVAPGPGRDGLYQPGRGGARGEYESGIEDYRNLVGREASFTKHRHPETGAPWIYDGKDWWTYDDPASVATKMSYVRSNLLGGAMFWELSGDTPDMSLLSAIYNGLQ